MNLGDHNSHDPARTTPNWVEEELLTWPFTIQRGRREERAVFASRGSRVRVSLAPLRRSSRSEAVSPVLLLIFMRRFSVVVPVACPIGRTSATAKGDGGYEEDGGGEGQGIIQPLRQ